MKIKYTGPYEAVEIAATGQVVKRGDVVDVPEEVGASLLKQNYWTQVKPTRAKKSTQEAN